MPDEKRPSLEALTLLYDEIAAELNGQRELTDHLNQRAQQIFSFVAVILALLPTVIPPTPSRWEQLAVVGVIPVLGVSGFYSSRAWSFRSWRRDPAAIPLWKHYRGKPEEFIRHAVIQNRLHAITTNDSQIENKRADAKRAKRALYLATAYVAVLVVYRVLAV